MYVVYLVFQECFLGLQSFLQAKQIAHNFKYHQAQLFSHHLEYWTVTLQEYNKGWFGSRLNSLIHSGYFYITSSSPLQLRGAPDTARILCRSFTRSATGNCE